MGILKFLAGMGIIYGAFMVVVYFMGKLWRDNE